MTLLGSPYREVKRTQTQKRKMLWVWLFLSTTSKAHILIMRTVSATCLNGECTEEGSLINSYSVNEFCLFCALSLTWDNSQTPSVPLKSLSSVRYRLSPPPIFSTTSDLVEKKSFIIYALFFTRPFTCLHY